MGTHPIFESDFDCLTEWQGVPDRDLGPEIGRRKKIEKEAEVEVGIEKKTKDATDQGHVTAQEAGHGTEKGTDPGKEEGPDPETEKTKNEKNLQKNQRERLLLP